ARQFTQRLRIRAANRTLGRQLLHELAQYRKRQLPLRIIGLRSRDNRTIHLTARRERVDERRLAHTRIARDDDYARQLAPGIDPGVVQDAELALASDERLGLKPAVSPLRRGASRSRTRGRSPAIAQQICHANQFGPGLRAEFVGQLCLVPRERLERAAAIARPCPRLHDSANPLFRERVELLQASGVALYRREGANPPRGVHLPHEAIAELGR